MNLIDYESNQLAVEPEVTVASGDAWMQRKEARTLYLKANELIKNQQYIGPIAMLRRAIALVPDDYAPWNELGVALHSLGRFDESRKALERALELKPDYNNARSNLALLQGVMREYDIALPTMRELATFPGRQVPEEIHLALTLLAKGDWQEGLEIYEKRVGMMCEEFRLPRMPLSYWTGEDLTDKTLYIQTEQGIGDSIAFSRFIPWIAKTWPTAKIMLCCHKELQNLFWEFRRYVTFVPAGVLWPEGGDAFHYGTYLHSLALRADTRVDSVHPDPGIIHQRIVEQHKKIPLNIPEPLFKQARKIGIAWTGNPANRTQIRRSIPLESLLYLATDPDNVLYSLQCGPGQKDIERLSAEYVVEDLSETISSDMVLCGAAMLELDVIVTCCTSIAHLAGAIGVPCFLLLCHDPYWLWGRDPDTTPWYPSVRVFRQKTRSDWGPVIAQVYDALQEM